MKNLLITGASGLVGRGLVKHCVSRYNLVGTYHSRDYRPDNFKLKHLDLSNSSEIEDCLDEVQPSIVIHCAALSDIQYCQKNQKQAEEINYRATAQLAAFCNQRGIRLVYLSSDMVFDGAKGNYSEEDSASPINQYGNSKYAAEESIKGIFENYVIARLNLVYGHGEAVKKSFTDSILIASWSGRSFPVFKGQIRTPIALDVASRAIRELAEGDFKGVYHLGGKETIDRWDFAVKLISFMKLDPSVIEDAELDDKQKEFYPVNTSFNTTKAETELKTELLTIDEGLRLEYHKYMD